METLRSDQGDIIEVLLEFFNQLSELQDDFI